jgi:hypothetical protein
MTDEILTTGDTPTAGDNKVPNTPQRSTDDMFTQRQVNTIVKNNIDKELEKLEKQFGMPLDKVKSALETVTTWQQKYETEAKAHRETLLSREVAIQAGKLGIVDPDAAHKLADLSKVAIGEDGSITGVEDALKALAEAKPYLVQAGTPPVQQQKQQPPKITATNPGSTPRITADDLRKMSARDIAEMDQETVFAALQEK